MNAMAVHVRFKLQPLLTNTQHPNWQKQDSMANNSLKQVIHK